MSATATTAPSVAAQKRDTELFPYRLSLPRTLVPKADFLVTIGFLGDIAMIFAGLALSFWLRFKSHLINLGNEPASIAWSDYAGLMGLGALFLLLTFGYLQLYNPRRIPGFRDAIRIVFKGATFWLFAYLGVSLVMRFQPSISRIYVSTAYVSCLATVLAWRWLYSRLLRASTIATTLRKRILFVGWTPEAARIEIGRASCRERV